MINLNEVEEGDQVTLEDRMRNLVIGVVKMGEGEGTMFIDVFGNSVTFARLAKRRKPPQEAFWAAIPGARVVGHLPKMF